MEKTKETNMQAQEEFLQARPGGSRRSFFTKSFMAAGAAAVTASLSSKLSAQSTTGGAPNDVAIINYALTLEYLEATFYSQGLSKFSTSDFNNAAFASVVGSKLNSNVYSYLGMIRDHELQHVAGLQEIVKSLGGTPVTACTYNFTYNTPDDFLMLAMAIENTGVMAYDGAIALLQNKSLIQGAATIATVEARHAAYLNLLNGSIPFPSAFDVPQTMQQILAAAGQFIGSCPTTMAVAGPKNFSTAQKQATLDASASMGGAPGDLSYAWRVASGSAALYNATSAKPTVAFNGGYGNYVFELTVTDSAGNSSKDTVNVLYTGR